MLADTGRGSGRDEEIGVHRERQKPRKSLGESIISLGDLVK